MNNVSNTRYPIDEDEQILDLFSEHGDSPVKLICELRKMIPFIPNGYTGRMMSGNLLYAMELSKQRFQSVISPNLLNAFEALEDQVKDRHESTGEQMYGRSA